MPMGDPVFGGNFLVREQEQSPNYVPGVSGWVIKKDGSAEFNNLTIRGTFNGTDFVMDSSGLFFYNGTPEAGNLILALAPAAGSDQFGNNYSQGLTVGAAGSEEQIVMGVLGTAPTMYFLSGIATALNNAALMLNITGAGTAAHDSLVIKSSDDTAHKDYVAANWNGNSNDGTAATSLSLAYVNALGAATFYEVLTALGAAFPLGLTVGSQPVATVQGEIFVANAAAAPANPVGGGALWAADGIPKWTDPNGQVLAMSKTSSAAATGNLSNFTAQTAIPGATLQVEVTGPSAKVIVDGHFDLNSGTGATLVGILEWAGASQTRQAVFTGPGRVNAGQTWEITGVAPGTYTAALFATCTAASTTNLVESTHTTITARVEEG